MLVWTAAASFKLNTGKIKAIVFGPARTVNKVIMMTGKLSVNLGIGGAVVSFSDTVTSLGSVLNSK